MKPTSTDTRSDPHFRPSFSWVFQSPARVVAFGAGSGVIRPAPGTWGTLAGWLVWVFVLGRLPDAVLASIIVLAFVLGCWACAVVGRELGTPDHGGMVWDEVVAIWLVLWLTPASLPMQILAFVLFRIFDIVKPPPVRYFDQRFKNGFGVMVDDLVAAGYALLVMALVVRFMGV
jgi:phosphatidylglycerophosphatase A